MKKITLIVALFAIGFGLNAQKTVNLKLNHKLGTSAFAFSQKSTNDMSNEFNFTRCEYYISKISIVHDSGKISNATGVYSLVDPSKISSIDLGMHTVTKVESINFSIGVDPGNNNGDPTKWANTHPLAPKNPSMHWGWSAGYRFAAIEGAAGNNLRTIWEVHALGNKNYFDINIPTAATVNGTALDITLDADYVKAVSGLNVKDGFTTHGADDEAYIVLRNFQNKVFTSTDGKTNTLSTVAPEKIANVNVFPNPSNGEATVRFDEALDATVNILDISGRTVQSLKAVNQKDVKVEALESGIYTIQIVASNQTSLTKRLIVN